MDRLSSPLGSSIYVTVLCRYVRSLSCWSSSLSASSPLRPLLFSPINIPTRQMRSREVKQFYSSEGDYNPPVNDVISRFKRLRWGAFIHARSGRRRHLYRRTEAVREKLSDHLLTNRATSFLLNNMLNDHWRKPQYYPDDIYEPYHQRTGVPWGYVLRKRKFFP
ncbi:unnamed protein product [Dicrocoelium dendriticum]|nr:unnamed protein product [Dicrocoelium dendriticum]